MWIGMFIVIFFIHEISISRDYLVSTQNTLRTAKGLEHLNTAWLCSGFSILNLQPGDVSQHKDANMYYTIKHYTSSLTIITYLLFCQKNSMNWNEFKKYVFKLKAAAKINEWENCSSSHKIRSVDILIAYIIEICKPQRYTHK